MKDTNLKSPDTLRERERERELTFSEINNRINLNEDSDKSLRN